MKNFDTRVYSIGDFIEWDNNALLELSPEFQRRGVWNKQAKSYLLDTIISGKPMPKILMTQNLSGSRTKRVIIDGQQRLRSVLEYCRDEFTISKVHNKEFGGIPFSELPTEIRNDIYKYELGVDVLFDLSYEETLDIFARLNTYSVRLNTQELLNAQYLGPFKQYAYQIGYQFVQYWLDNGVLTSSKISRMGEAELASDMLVVAVDGIQTNKNIEKFYKLYEEENSLPVKYSKNVTKSLEFIKNLYSDKTLKQTNYRRIHLFYSLFCCVHHNLYGIENLSAPKLNNFSKKTGKIRIALDDFSSMFDEEHRSLEKFIEASRRGTTDTSTRKYRAEVLCKHLSRIK